MRPCQTCVFGLILWGPCFAQQSPPSATHNREQEIVIPANVVEVVVPTTVRGKNRELLHGVQLSEFEVYDNNKIQSVKADLAEEPIALVVAIQQSSYLDGALRNIQKSGSQLNDSVAGEDGEVAVIGFDHEVHVLQNFTGETEKISEAMKNMKLGSANHALVEAVTESTRMLQKRPVNRRRVLLLIAERRDKGSGMQLSEALTRAQMANVSIYALDITSLVALASKKSSQPPPRLPVTAQHVPAGAALTPTTIDQNYYNGNYVPAFVELFHGIKNIYVPDDLDLLTSFTGGKQYRLTTGGSLEYALQSISEEVHSQYLISYIPNNQEETGFHQIRVHVRRPGAETQARLGYWLAAKP